LARRLQTIREEERVELSRTIHDELGQSLTALKIDLSMISKRLDPAHKPQVSVVRDQIEASAAAVDRMIQQVRNIATELRPGVLDHLGLAAAMEWQAKEFTRRSGIECQFIPPSEEPVLSQDQAVSLFRILQESLTNVVRHAQAHTVTVSLKADLESVQLMIEDDGIGLTEERRKHHSSLGLIGMEERARFIDARLAIGSRGSSAGSGTRVVVDLPLRSEETLKSEEVSAT
jgi:signal transduction histidine kinase